MRNYKEKKLEMQKHSARKVIFESDSSSCGSNSDSESESESVKGSNMNNTVQVELSSAAKKRSSVAYTYKDDLSIGSISSLEDCFDTLAIDKKYASPGVTVPKHDTQHSATRSDKKINKAWKYDRQLREYVLAIEGRNPPVSIPEGLFDKLYDFQKVGVQWMSSLHSNRIGGILGDDMGMGKTYMTCAYIGGMMRAKKIKSALVVAPVSVLRSWESTAKDLVSQCAKNVRVQVVSSDIAKSRRTRLLQDALIRCSSSQPVIVVTTYGLVRSATMDFVTPNEQYCWDYVILDEGHNVKNHNSEISRCVRRICRSTDTRRMMLTGTPIQNNMNELWALFDWATCGQILGDMRSFNNYFGRPIEDARNKGATDRQMELGIRVNKELQDTLKPYFLQRMKADFLQDKLPTKTEMVVWTHISSKQRELYSEFVTSGRLVRDVLSGEKTSPLEAITELKNLCAHPLLFEKTDWEAKLHERNADHIMRDSAKLSVLLNLVDTFRRDGHRTLIFSQSTRVLDIIGKVLHHVNLCRLDGKTKEKDRQRMVDDFNSANCRIEAMLLSTKAGGVGLTLVGADRVIIYDPSWTPAEDSQAVDRCYRIGQKREVLVYRLIAAGTVEEKMYEKQIHKDGIRRMVFTQDQTVERYFEKHELRKLFTLGEPGVCETMEKVKQSTTNFDWQRHSNTINHSSVVGVSRHDGFYSQNSNKPYDKSGGHNESKPESNPFMSVTPGKVKIGKAGRVMQNDDVELVKAQKPRSGRIVKPHSETYQPNVDTEIISISSSDDEMEGLTKPTLTKPWQTARPNTEELISVASRSTTSVHDDDGNDNNDNDSDMNKLLQEIDGMIVNDMPRRALKELVTIASNHNEDLGKDEKMFVHDRISTVGGKLGLLE